METTKKKSIIIMISLLLTVSVNAQKFHYGIKAGSNFAVQSQVADYFNNSDIRIGFSVGAFGNYLLNEHLTLQGEINYEQKGGKSATKENNYDYLSVPFILKYSLGKSDLTPIRFNINFGPYAGYLLNSKVISEGVTTDMKNESNTMEYGAVTGFGMEYPIGKNSITADLRLSLGLTGYQKNNSTPKNKYVGITLGYQF